MTVWDTWIEWKQIRVQIFFFFNAEWPKAHCRKKTDRTEFRLHAKNHIFLFHTLPLYGTCRTLLLVLNIWKTSNDWVRISATTNHTVHYTRIKNSILAIWLFATLPWREWDHEVIEELCTYRSRWFESLQVPDHYKSMINLHARKCWEQKKLYCDM